MTKGLSSVTEELYWFSFGFLNKDVQYIFIARNEFISHVLKVQGWNGTRN